eukprot:CAMPEP_0113432370 /NCGR_PEP_ID=MMETSP0013_2-20120614/34139_1 /TAXON_ID=2843 ORGANISM="Skeletonema costatum, Strain 1716" /NCGR_SAMPLE_ID=MMETSP0013_2 /ASSEMBLY_ACC=CAM_ASM_000158 /LENGTH=30 /DNA_ID=CAMNT_0000321539 /DNA_START=118 /DNA_END=207 /DNA_ORIENTATION=+ /assembly_acc=CAM_ASM_000158
MTFSNPKVIIEIKSEINGENEVVMTNNNNG